MDSNQEKRDVCKIDQQPFHLGGIGFISLSKYSKYESRGIKTYAKAFGVSFKSK